MSLPSPIRPNERSSVHRPTYIPLIKSLAEIYATSEGKYALRSSSKMFAPVYRMDHTRYCEFHNDHGHDTKDCVNLRKEIETCIRNGRLSHLAKGAKIQNSSQNPIPSGATEKGKNQTYWKQKVVAPKAGNEILVIDEGWSPPHYQENGLRHNADISFTSDDPVTDHCSSDDPLLDNETKASLRLLTSPLVGFLGQVLWPLKVIIAPFTFSDYTEKGTIASMIHSLIKFPLKSGIAIIRGDVPHKSICLQISRKRERECERKSVGIGTSLPTRIKQELRRILCENKDIFAWSPSDMTGILRELAEHKLNIHPRTFPIWQKKRVLAKDWNEAVTAEVSKLVKA
ncbi:hypothetical protein Tco_1243630 [Tanacetum coccineum]